MIGKIKFFNVAKGYGFIIPENGGGQDVFFHATKCEKGYEPKKDDEVEYELTEGRKGPEASIVAKR